MSRVAVLGERDAVLGFKSSGAVVFVADSASEAKEGLNRVLDGDYAILFVTEAASEFLSAELAVLYDSPKPVVTILPDAKRAHSLGKELLRKRVERAIGANILFKEEG